MCLVACCWNVAFGTGVLDVFAVIVSWSSFFVLPHVLFTLVSDCIFELDSPACPRMRMFFQSFGCCTHMTRITRLSDVASNMNQVAGHAARVARLRNTGPAASFEHRE